ncbi:MAG: glycosyltransferase, partial [Gammaproteobacteria bacterium]
WTGSLRQRVASVVAPWYLHSAIDVLWVSGERQRQLARRLGYAGARCWSGYYACDWDRFADVYRRVGSARPRAFLYVGRYVPIKGLDILLTAYRQYRAQVTDPWPLICVGSGEQEVLLQGVEGVYNQGFVQPQDLPEQMAQASAFVLPSRREPWGVVVQEAAAAGMPLICSDVCGAAVHLLQDGYNGYLFESGNASHLSDCMGRVTEAPLAHWEAMSKRSHQLSAQYTPHRWADTLIQGVKSWIACMR